MRYLIITIVLFALTLSTGFSQRALAADDPFRPFNDICYTEPNATVCQEAQKPQDADSLNSFYGPNGILSKVTTIVSIIIGVASVIVIIIGGIKYAMSGGESAGRRQGDPSGVNSARNTILYAIFGLIFAISAYSIVTFVINKL